MPFSDTALGTWCVRRSQQLFTRHEWRPVLLLGCANFFDHYDSGLLGLILPRLQHDLAIPESRLGTLLGITRLGPIFVLGVTLAADRHGRQKLLMASIGGFTVATLASALATSAYQFTFFQFAARFFVAAEGLLAITVLTEELAPARRGRGISALALLAAMGTGLASFTFGFIDHVPFGWRALYMLGAPALLLVLWQRRSMRETRQFEELRERLAPQTGWQAFFRPLVSCLSAYPGRLLSLSGGVFLFEFALGPSFLLSAKHLQEVHHYTPAMISTLIITGGAAATLLATYAGAMSDRVGRKWTLGAMIVAAQLTTIVFYLCSGALVPLSWMLMIGTTTAATTLFQVLSTELFPTSYRSTASGARFAVANVAGALGLMCETLLWKAFHSHATAIALLALIGLAALLAPVLLPESANRSLDRISPERSC